MNIEDEILIDDNKMDMYVKKRTIKGNNIDTFGVDGELIPVPENFKTGRNITVINRHNKQHIFINGYEIIDGEMKKTLRAFWHKWF